MADWDVFLDAYQKVKMQREGLVEIIKDLFDELPKSKQEKWKKKIEKEVEKDGKS